MNFFFNISVAHDFFHLKNVLQTGFSLPFFFENHSPLQPPPPDEVKWSVSSNNRKRRTNHEKVAETTCTKEN